MTRAHARLLGPCFKTGPESTQSYGVADERVTEPARGHRRQQLTGSGAGARSGDRMIRTNLRRACARATRDPTPTSVCYRRASRPENAGPRPPHETGPRTTQRTSDRHPTGRDVLQGEKCMPSRPNRKTVGAATARSEDRPTPSRVRSTPTQREAIESPPSTFRVSQVYP